MGQTPGRANQMHETVEAPVGSPGVIADLPLSCPACRPVWWIADRSPIPVSLFGYRMDWGLEMGPASLSVKR